MKKTITFYVILLAAMLLPMSSWAQDTGQQPIQITFAGSGDTETVESVLVENLSQPGEEIDMKGTDILVLSQEGTGIEDVVAGNGTAATEPLLYPNPAQGDGNLVFDVNEDGEVRVTISALNGSIVDAATIQVIKGRNSIRIPAQGYGYFMINVEGDGLHFAKKWLCGAEPTYSGIQHNGVSSMQLPASQIKETRAEAPAKSYLKFNAGDLLRMTATSGKIKTIVLQRPTVDHTVVFQLYQCEDADGYNYPTIEVGGMLWMAEDLRVVNKSGVARMFDASSWTDADASPLRMAYEDFDEANAHKGGYYTPRAAMKALPAGWELPTANELQTVNEYLGGAKIAGKLLKAHGDDSNWATIDDSADEVQLGLLANGYLAADGKFKGRHSAAYVVTRSFTNGNPCVMRLGDGQDNAQLSLDIVAPAGEGYTIRGVRPAQSPYNGFISKWLANHPENAPKVIQKAGLEGNPFTYTAPLGSKYQIAQGAHEFIAFDRVFKNGSAINKYKETLNLAPTTMDLKDKPYYLFLHEYVPQTMADGLQRTLRLTWSNPTNNYPHSWHTDGDSLMYGPGTVHLEVFNSGAEAFNLVEALDLDYDFTMLGAKDLKSWKDAASKYKGRSMANTAKWFLEQYSQTIQNACIDFTGDGTDDLLVAVGRTMVILDGTDFKKVIFKHEFTQVTNEYQSLFCAVGDINDDGNPDLAITYANNGNIYMEAWWHGLESFKGEPDEKRILGTSADCLHSVMIADVDMDNKTDVVTLYWNRIYNQKTPMRLLVSTYDPELKRLTETNNVEKMVDCSEGKEGTYLGNTEMKLARLRGIQFPPDLIANGILFRLNENKKYEEKYLVAEWENGRYLNSHHFAIGNFDGNEEGKEQIIMLQYRITPYAYWGADGSDHTMYVEYWIAMVAEKKGTPSRISISGSDWDGHWPDKHRFVDQYHYNYRFYNFTSVRATAPVREMKLERIETTMTEPRIYALLAAPPYWKGYEEYLDLSGTSWGYSNSQGQGSSNSSTCEASVVTGFEYEYTDPILNIELGGVDFEQEISNSVTRTGEKSEEKSFGVDYTTFLDDAVVLTLTPFTAYYYKITKSQNPDEIGNELMIGTPGKPRNMAVTMDDYMKLRADNKEIPDLKKIFRHEVGNPYSYKAEYINSLPLKNEYFPVMWYNNKMDDWQDVGSGTAISRTIEVTEEQVQISENEFNMSTTLVGKTGGVKAGYGFGTGVSSSQSHSESKGHTVSGTVMAPKSLEDADAKSFGWNICRANVKFGGQVFPVVTYAVREAQVK